VNAKKIYTVIYYISIIFIAAYLFRSDYFSFSRIDFNTDFFLSLIFLTAGFISYPAALNLTLKYQGIGSDYKTCFLSTGRTIFSKYIPGKVAMIYAIAYNLKKNDESSLSRLSYNVILFQIFAIISGILLGLAFVIPMESLPFFWKFGSIAVIITSVLILSSNFFFTSLTKLFVKFTGKSPDFPPFTFLSIFKLISMSMLFWLCWGMGLYFLVGSLGIILNNSLTLVFLFPFSISIGILAFIAPGGIGVREGVLAALLIYSGNPVPVAAEISVMSRIWFILGEIIFFLISSTIPYLYTFYNKRRR